MRLIKMVAGLFLRVLEVEELWGVGFGFRV